MVICLERGADLHMAQLMPLPLTVSCFSKIQIGFTFLVPADLGIPGKRAIKRVCVWDRQTDVRLMLYGNMLLAVVHVQYVCSTTTIYYNHLTASFLGQPPSA